MYKVILSFNPLERAYVPSSPNIAPLIGAALLAGAGSIISSGLGAVASHHGYSTSLNGQKELNEQQQEYNKQNMLAQYGYSKGLMSMQNDYNTRAMALQYQYANRMASNQQDWTQQNMRLSSDLEYQNWLNSFNAENAYNDPSAQRARLEAAGYNPQLANGTVNTVGGSGMSSSPVGASPSASVSGALGVSSGSVGLPSVSAGVAPTLDLGSNIKNMADSIGSVFQTALQYGLGKHQILKMAAETKKTITENALQELDLATEQLPYIGENGWIPPTNDDGQPVTIKQAREMGLAKQANVLVEKFRNESDVYAWKKVLESQEYFQLEKTNPDAARTVKAIADKAIKDVDKVDHEINVLDSTANWYDTQSDDNKETRPYRKANLSSSTRLNNTMADDNIATRQHRIDQLDASTKELLSRSQVNFQTVDNLFQEYQQNDYRWKTRLDSVIDKAVSDAKISKSAADKAHYKTSEYLKYHKAGEKSFPNFCNFIGSLAADIGGDVLNGLFK